MGCDKVVCVYVLACVKLFMLNLCVCEVMVCERWYVIKLYVKDCV